uniref:Nitric oxide synthase-interacting protein homolog n=1 Tax=Rhabditophanes sp. KR3021 TaxID=114890 RepID=A0AC35UH31_9BILA
MTRHGKNSGNSGVYSYSERSIDKKQSAYGSKQLRLGKDSLNGFDCCNLTFQPCQNPVITPEGIIFDKTAITLYFEQQMKKIKRNLQLYEKQAADADTIKNEDSDKKTSTELYEKSKSLSEEKSGSKSRKRTHADSDDETESKFYKKEEVNISNIEGANKTKLPSFWCAELAPSAKETSTVQKPTVQKVLCPITGSPLKFKQLMDVKFTSISDNNKKQHIAGKKDRYMCPISHDVLTQSTKCVYLKTSGSVITKEAFEKTIRKDMVDPINGKKIKPNDIIELKGSGSGYSGSSSNLQAIVHGPIMQAG